MELRKLKALLGALRDAGVTSYRDADVNVQFGAAPVLVPEGDITGDPDDLKLPPDVPDVARALAHIRKQYERKDGRAS